MTNVPEQQTITPERQAAAAQIGAVFNSLHAYLSGMEHKNEAGTSVLTKQLEFAHQRVDEAAMWAIKHALVYGVPAPAAPAASEPTEPNDPAPLPTDHASGTEAV